MFKIVPGRKFINQAEKLSYPERKQLKKTLTLLAANPRHPSLRTKSYQSAPEVMECRVSRTIRILWKYAERDVILLIYIGHHDIL